MKQKLFSVLIFNLLLLSLWSIKDRASATEQPSKTESPATTVKQWRSQSNNSLTHIIEIRTQKTLQGIEIRVITRDNKVLRGIQSVEGNNLVIDFPNTRLNPRLVEGVPDSSKGISALKVTGADNTVRIIISGEEGTPTGELNVERRQKAEGRGQKDRSLGDSDAPVNVDRQIEDSGGGFKPKKVEGERTAEPSAICPSSAASSAFQGGSLGNYARFRCNY